MSPEPSSSARTQGTTTRPPGLSDFKAFSDLWSSGGFTKASKFLLQSKLYPQELKEFQEVLVDESDKLEDTLGHTGQVIFDNDTTQDRRARIYLASVASKAVYNMHGGTSSPDNITKQAMSIMESRYSLMKRDYLNVPFLSEKPKDWMLCTPNDDTRDRFYIFAVKGSAGADDWLDNLNGGNDPKVQQGLLKEGKEMYDDAAVTLRDLLKDEKRVLFTGHSGGGAVAAYVYKELYSEAVKDQASWKMDCVVFGCAAASNEQVTYPVPGMPGENGIQTRGEQNKDTDTVNNNTNIRIAFVNRYDPVPRATTAYVYWFLNKWNKYHESPNKDRVTATDLPTDSLVPFGQIVTLFNKGEGTTSTTNARWLTREEFQGVVYLDPTRHPMTVYLGNVFRLLKQSGYEGIDNKMWNIVNSAGGVSARLYN